MLGVSLFMEPTIYTICIDFRVDGLEYWGPFKSDIGPLQEVYKNYIRVI